MQCDDGMSSSEEEVDANYWSEDEDDNMRPMDTEAWARGAQGGSHMPPLEIVIDPITTAAFRNKTPYAKFNQLRHGFKLW